MRMKGIRICLKWLKSGRQMYYCAFIGSFGEYACNPRTLSSTHLNHLVSLEGIVTKCSLVRPKVVKSVHYNEKKNIFHFREYRDQTMTANGAASTSVYPQEDEDGNPVSILWARIDISAQALIISSSSPSTVTVPTEIIKPYRFRRCQNVHLQDSCLEASMSLWMMIWSIG